MNQTHRNITKTRLEPDFWIRVGHLMDCDTNVPQKKILIHVNNGSILDVIKDDGSEPGIVGKVIDYSTCTILPGMVDCHVHLSWSAGGTPDERKAQIDATFDKAQAVIAKNLDRQLAFGVLAVRDGGDKNGNSLRYGIENRDAHKHPCEIRSPGRAFHKPSRYGGLIGRAVNSLEELFGELRREYPLLDHVKIVNSGLNSLKEFGKKTPPQFTMDEMKAIIEQVKTFGLKVMVHANGEEPVRIAVEAGCDSIEHGFFMGKDNLKRMTDLNAVWVPTACTMSAYAKTLAKGSLEAEIAARYLDTQIDQMAIAKDIGTKIALGTDAGSLGVYHGNAVIDEMKHLLSAGFRPEEAIGCASKNGGNLVGFETGSIRRGKPFHCIAVKGKPEDFPDFFHGVEAVFVNGNVTVHSPPETAPAQNRVG